jgi:NADH-quinone oxidoreductase subunit M
MKDLDGREFLVLGLLAVGVLLLGVWPAPLLDMMRGAIEHLTSQILATKL